MVYFNQFPPVYMELVDGCYLSRRGASGKKQMLVHIVCFVSHMCVRMNMQLNGGTR